MIRAGIESVLAVVWTVLAIVTSLKPDWLETLSLNPDGGNSTVEWLIVAALGAAALTSALHARRLARCAESHGPGCGLVAVR